MHRLNARRTRPRPLVPALAALTLLVACGRSVPSELRVNGPHGFVRCLRLEPPSSREWQAGGLSLSLAERVLTIRGTASPLRLAALAGPAPAGDDGATALNAVKARRPQLLLVLGGLGDDPAQATQTARALAATNLVTLFVAGGRDEPEAVAAALAALDAEARGRVLDVTALERVVVGGAEFVPVGGAPGGRYARTSGACGHDAADLDARAVALGGASDRVRRVLLSWAAATPAPGLEGAEAGDAELARFATRVGAEDALAAWPRELAGQALPGGGLRRVVAGAGSIASLGAQGGRARPGASFLTLGPAGLASDGDGAPSR